jgi:hypothetical protein
MSPPFQLDVSNDIRVLYSKSDNAGAYGALGRPGKTIEDVLHGTRPLGHPLHPALTDVPLGAWIVGVVADLAALATRSVPSAAGNLALLVGVAGAPVVGRPQPAPAGRGPERGGPGCGALRRLPVAVGRSEDFPEGAPRRVQAGPMPALVVRRHGRLLAIGAVCSHAGGAWPWRLPVLRSAAGRGRVRRGRAPWRRPPG